MMNTSEKKTYLIAVIIVIVGTLLITAVFTIGLLSLTESDNHILTEDKIAFNIENKSSDFSSDIQTDSSDWIIPVEIPSIDESGLKTDLDEEFEEKIKEVPASLDEYRQATRIFENLRKSGAAARRSGNRWILIDKSNFSLTLNNRNGVLREWEIAVGTGKGNKRNKGDNRTPTGTFMISQIQDSSKWTHDFRDGKGEIQGAYGPWFIRLKTPPWTGIGIHGTHDPNSIGERVSEGCIRMNNKDVSELKKLVKVGMAVIIVE